jgi:hypothetical protein
LPASQLNSRDHADDIFQQQAEVSDVNGDDRRTFTNPTKSCNAFAEAMRKGATVQFKECGSIYVLTDM